MAEKSPFKFLDSYTSDDRNIFFGREHEVEELYHKIFSARQLILYGSSGTGKTSIVQCGLAAKFEETDWMPVIIRRGDNMNAAVRSTLSQIAITPMRKANAMAEYIHSVYLDFFKPLYLIFDQFEELFIFGSDDEINQFIAELKECLSSDISCRFVFVIRGEYLENIVRFEESIAQFFNNRMSIERMTRSNATRVITESCKAFNIYYSENFPTLLLDRLSPEKTTVELTYLQVYLDKLYKNAAENNKEQIVFDEELLKKSGMIEDVLSEFLDEQVAHTKEPEAAMVILKAFVSGEGTRKPCTLSEVKEFCFSLGKKQDDEKTAWLLKQFVDLRILKDKDEAGHYELRHDALAHKIYEQISLGEKELLEVRQFFMNRYAEYQRRGVLLDLQDTNYLIPYETRLFLNSDQRQFLERSQRIIRRRRNRRRNIALAMASVMLVVLAGFSLAAFTERNAAIAQTRIAEQKTLETLHEKEEAEKAKVIAQAASQQALQQKKIAEEQSQIANEQKRIAEQKSMEAKNQSELAEKQKQNAEQHEQVAKQQSQEALHQKMLAEQSSAEANRLRLISIGQNLAIRSLQEKNDPTLAALLACFSYQLLEENQGNLFDPQLYQALSFSYHKLQPSATQSVVKFTTPIKSTAMATDSTIGVFCSDGTIYHLSGSGSSKGKISLPQSTAGLDAAFFSNDSRYLITSYADFSTKLWDVSNPDAAVINAQEHTGLIRAVAFSSPSWFATAGRDSMIVIWENGRAASKIHLPSRIRSIVTNSDHSVLFAGCEDGNIYSVNSSSKNYIILTSIAGARVQVLQLDSNDLIGGCSNGMVRVFDIRKNKIVRDLNLGNSIEFVDMNRQQDVLIAGCNNHSIFTYRRSDFSLRPLKIDDVIPGANNSFISSNGTLYVTCADNALRKRSISSSWLYQTTAALLKRDFTEDEWNEYIGSDVPYEKIQRQ